MDDKDAVQPDPPSLNRTLGPVTVTFYGVGTMIGAGIYVLLGSVAGFAGNAFPYSFLVAGAIALFTALSYAELSAKLPQCAGATVYIDTAWHQRWLSILVGWMLVFTGIVSASAIANGFVGYLNEFLSLSTLIAIPGLVFLLGLIAALNMKASALLVLGVTLVEMAGLLLVIVAAWLTTPANVTPIPATDFSNSSLWVGVTLGSFVAFYAFIGFEDMVNIIEEVKNPTRNVPLAVVGAVLITLLLYVLLAFSALRVVSAPELAASAAPLSEILAASGGNRRLIALISLVAVTNGALVQIIMASRVIYGMAGRGMAPKWLGKINRFTRTPLAATVLVALLILIFALALPITQLAQLTSFVMLMVFLLVNLSLVRIKCLHDVDYTGVSFPMLMPIMGSITCLILLVFQTYTVVVGFVVGL